MTQAFDVYASPADLLEVIDFLEDQPGDIAIEESRRITAVKAVIDFRAELGQPMSPALAEKLIEYTAADPYRITIESDAVAVAFKLRFDDHLELRPA